MKVMPSRRSWRTFYRRIRVYLPIVVLLLAATALLLPLSAPWMARRLEREIATRAGLAVTVQRVRVTLLRGEVIASGIELAPADAGGTPYRVDVVRLSGSPLNLLAGDGSWPELVELDSPSAIDIAQRPDGSIELLGAAATLADAGSRARGGRVEATGGPPKAPVAGDFSLASKLLPRTPEVIVRDLVIRAEPPSPALPPIELAISRIVMAKRETASSPVTIDASGAALADTSEDWWLRLAWKPETSRVSLDGTLGGFALPIKVPNFGDLQLSLESISAGVDVTETQGDQARDIAIGAEITAGRFELAEKAVGGERWVDRDVRLRVRAVFDAFRRRIIVREARISGNEIAVDVSGSVTVAQDFPGEARLNIQKLPTAAINVARTRAAREIQLQVAPYETSPTLQLEAAVRGPFLDPGNLNGGASLQFAGWSFRAPGWPEELRISNLRLRANRDEVVLEPLEANVGRLRMRSEGTIAIPMHEGQETTGTLRFTADGPASTLLLIAQRLKVVPRELASADLPLTLSLTSDLRLRRVTDGAGGIRVVATPDVRDCSLLWGKGTVTLYKASEPIQLDPGELVYGGDGSIQLRRLVASAGGSRVLANGRLSGRPVATLGREPGPLSAQLRIEADGRTEDLGAFIARVTPLPFPPDAVAGRFHAELDIEGSSDRLLEPDYRLRLTVDDGAWKIPLRPYPLEVRNASLELLATTSTVQLKRLSASVEDNRTPTSYVDLSVSVTPDAVSLEGDVNTTFQILQTVAPQDLAEFVAEGPLPARVTARLKRNAPFGNEPDLIRRWIGVLQRHARDIDIKPAAPLALSFRADYTQNTPVKFYARDMPIEISNIRGNAYIDENGIFFNNMLADAGSGRNMRVRGSVVIQRLRTDMKFEVETDVLNINEWIEGWGTKPWAARPMASRIPRQEAQPRLMATFEGRVRARRASLYQYSGKNLDGILRIELWKQKEDMLKITGVSVDAYDGRAYCDASFTLDPVTPTEMTLGGRVEEFDVRKFLTDFRRGEREEMTGKMSGRISLTGQLLDSETYRGSGNITVTKSDLIGGQVFRALGAAMRLTSKTGGHDTTMDTTYRVERRDILLPDLVVESPAVLLNADGKITFDGLLDFNVTANVLSRRLSGLPFVDAALDIFSAVTDALLSFHVTGSVRKPRVEAVPLMADKIGLVGGRRVSGMDGRSEAPRAKGR